MGGNRNRLWCARLVRRVESRCRGGWDAPRFSSDQKFASTKVMLSLGSYAERHMLVKEIDRGAQP